MERKFTFFALFYFAFEGKFQVQAPPGAYIRRSDLTEGFLRYDFGGLISGGAYFRNFKVYCSAESRPWDCTGTVYAVMYEVDNTKNRSEPLRGKTHPYLLYQNRLVCLVVIKVLCFRFYSYQILLQKWWGIHFKYKCLVLSKNFKASLPVSAKSSKV